MEIKSEFLYSKSKVAAIMNASLPRLDLSEELLLAKLCQKIVFALIPTFNGSCIGQIQPSCLIDHFKSFQMKTLLAVAMP